MGLWTPEHAMTLLPALAVMVLLSVVLRKYLKNSREETRMLPIKIIACLLVVLEIGKQTLSLMRGYDLYHLPFHICSLFIFLVPVMAFYRGKYHRQMYAVTSAFCGSVFLLMLIYPNLIYSAGNIQMFFTDYFSFHTVAFHNLVLLAFLLIVALELHQPRKGDQKAVVAFTVGFCVVSSVMAQLLRTNYANFYQCNIPVFEDLRKMMQGNIGYVGTQILYVVIVSVLTILFVLMSYHFCRLARAVFVRRKTPC